MKSFGNSQMSTGYKLYKFNSIRGKTKYRILSWINRKCKDCGRFLPNSNKGLRCNTCSKKYHIKVCSNKHNQWRKNHKKEARENMREYREREKASNKKKVE